MDLVLYLLVSEPDPRLARVVSLADLGRLPLPVLTHGDRLIVSIYLITSAGAYHADSTDASLSRTLTLGVRGQAALAQTSTFTAISNGYSCTLDLDSTQLALVLGAARAGQLALVHKTTGSGPTPTTRCSLDCSILGDVATVGNGTSLSESGYYTEAEVDAFLAGLTGAALTETVAAGSTVTVGLGGSRTRFAQITCSGVGTAIVILSASSVIDGGFIALRLVLPALAGLTVEIRNETAGGTLLASVATDGTAGTVGVLCDRGASAWREPTAAGWLD